MAEAKALEVSLNIPDHSEGTVSGDSADPSSFAKQQHEVNGYFSPNENEMDNNLTTEDKHASLAVSTVMKSNISWMILKGQSTN